MKLFFSYGHDENEEIVMRLKQDIEEREHSVWIDKSQIKSGDDWRRTITAGILDSEFMMSFCFLQAIIRCESTACVQRIVFAEPII